MNDQWYINRDKRTDNCDSVNASYKSATINVVIKENADQYRVQLLTLIALKIMAKWCRNINLTIECAKSMLSSKDESFADFLRREIASVDPHCIFHINTKHEKNVTNLCLFIGNPDKDFEDDFIAVNASGWVAACGFNRPVEIINSNDRCCIGLAFAANLANAALFRYLIGDKDMPNATYYSLWQKDVYDTPPPQEAYGLENIEIDFGKIHLIGCGAIGSSFVFLFPYTRCSAEFLFVDPDFVQDHNTSSSLLFNFYDAEAGRIKAEVCKELFDAAGIKNSFHKGDYKEVEIDYQSTGIMAPDIVLCFANENNIWSTIQNVYPPLCFHATTSKSWGIHIGRHIPLKDSCILCTFENLMEVQYVPVCAATEIEVAPENQKETHTAILPFLAPAAAVVTLAEMIKTAMQQNSSENEVIFNMKTSDGIFVGNVTKFGGCYVCKDQERLYAEFGATTKFWHLSK